MATDYGIDFHCVDDLDASLSVVSGPIVVAEAICRRLETPRGGLWYDRHYGTDLRRFLNGSPRRRQVESAIERECEKDSRVASATASVKLEAGKITATIVLELAVGPFALVIGVTEVSVELVSFNAAA